MPPDARRGEPPRRAIERVNVPWTRPRTHRGIALLVPVDVVGHARVARAARRAAALEREDSVIAWISDKLERNKGRTKLP